MRALLSLIILLVAFESGAQCTNCAARKILQPFDTILRQSAENKISRKDVRRGLWDFSVAQNATHGDYWNLDTTWGRHSIDTGTIRCRGFYDKTGTPYGVWVKYMRGYNENCREYFFFEKGLCGKHVYYNFHHGSWLVDSLNSTRDTLYSGFFLYPNEHDINRMFSNSPGTFIIGDKWLLPRDSCFRHRTYRRDNWVQEMVTDSKGKFISEQAFQFIADSTFIYTYDNENGTYILEIFIGWPANTIPVERRKFRMSDDVEIKE